VGATVDRCVRAFALGSWWGTDGDGTSAAWYYDPSAGWIDITYTADSYRNSDVGAPDVCNDIWQIDPTFDAYFCATPDGTREHPYNAISPECDAAHDQGYGLEQGMLLQCSADSGWSQVFD
jgi:hypothetical protein